MLKLWQACDSRLVAKSLSQHPRQSLDVETQAAPIDSCTVGPTWNCLSFTSTLAWLALPCWSFCDGTAKPLPPHLQFCLHLPLQGFHPLLQAHLPLFGAVSLREKRDIIWGCMHFQRHESNWGWDSSLWPKCMPFPKLLLHLILLWYICIESGPTASIFAISFSRYAKSLSWSTYSEYRAKKNNRASTISN